MFSLTYTPDGGERRRFEFDPDNPLSLEAEALESAGGAAWEDYAAWLLRLGGGNIRARRALLWVMLRRSDPSVRFVDVVFKLDEFSIEEPESEPEPVGKDEPAESGTASPSPQPDSGQSPNNSAGT